MSDSTPPKVYITFGGVFVLRENKNVLTYLTVCGIIVDRKF